MMTWLEHALASRWAYNAWIAILFIVLLLTCQKLWRMKGEHWWRHFTHVVMIAAMVYMYAAMSFRLDWISRHALLCVFLVISAGVLCWMLVQRRRRGGVGKFWMMTFVQQVSMAYMCVASLEWIPALTYALVVYFALETLFWSRGAVLREGAGWASRLHWPRAEDIGMAAMAASMGYMFLAMQLKASQSATEAIAAQSQSSLPKTDDRPPENLAPRDATQAASIAVPAKSAVSGSTPPGDVYRVVAGDSLYRIAGRLYGDGGRWPEVAAANPGLDPRRLRAGSLIKLSAPPVPP